MQTKVIYIPYIFKITFIMQFYLSFLPSLQGPGTQCLQFKNCLVTGRSCDTHTHTHCRARNPDDNASNSSDSYIMLNVHPDCTLISSEKTTVRNLAEHNRHLAEAKLGQPQARHDTNPREYPQTGTSALSIFIILHFKKGIRNEHYKI